MEERNNELPYENEEPILPDAEAPAEETPAEPAPETPAEAPAKEEPSRAARDYAGEVRALYAARPELRGQALPPEVAQACIGGKRLTEAYSDYALRQRRDAASLEQENRILRQNAAAAAHAPVRGVAHGPSPASQSEDAFLKGFNEGW